MASRLETGSRAEAKREQVLAGARRVFLRDGFAAAQDGTLSDGQGVTSVQKITSANLPQVRYRVTFDRDVSRCAYVATVGHTGPGNPGFGTDEVQAKGGSPSTRSTSSSPIQAPRRLPL